MSREPCSAEIKASGRPWSPGQRQCCSSRVGEIRERCKASTGWEVGAPESRRPKTCGQMLSKQCPVSFLHRYCHFSAALPSWGSLAPLDVCGFCSSQSPEADRVPGIGGHPPWTLLGPWCPALTVRAPSLLWHSLKASEQMVYGTHQAVTIPEMGWPQKSRTTWKAHFRPHGLKAFSLRPTDL